MAQSMVVSLIHIIHIFNYYLKLALWALFRNNLLIIIFFNIIKILSDKLSKLNFDQNDCLLSLYICLFITLWPIIPTGNFFHNWLCIIYYLPLGLLIYIQNLKNINETNY